MRARSFLGRPVQLAYATDDVWSGAARFAASTGAGPFFVVEHIDVPTAIVRGEAGSFDHSSAYGQWGDVMVELVHEHTPALGPAAPALHHVAFMVGSLPDSIAACAAQGWPELLHATTGGGQQFAFCDARAALGHLVELYEPSDRLRGFYAVVAEASAGWDGSDAVRALR
jgi:catechol 2,3-dioxygenase-like lactoylglutathione lyase family enzyme